MGLDTLKAKVERSRSLVQGTTVLLHGIADELEKLREVGASASDLTALADEIRAADIDLTNALLHGTSAHAQQVPAEPPAPPAEEAAPTE